jgi:hypothetical protein
MRLRLVDLPMIGWALLSFLAFGVVLISLALVSLMTIGLIPPVHAAGLDQAYLRGSTADTYSVDAPSYPVYPTTAAIPPPSYPVRAAAARPRFAVPPPPAQLSGYTFKLGTRVWLSTGRLAKDLYDDPRSSQNLNSRLTYSGLTSSAFEGFGRADTPFGSFFKGYAGFSNLSRGALNDEDFPPALTPYSNTLSQQEGGKLAYGAIDFGQVVAQNDRIRASLFVGYGYLNEKVSAFGCDQIAGNPFICSPALEPSLLAITEDARWQFARLGVLTEIRLLDRLSLSAEVAWLPYVQISSADTHWLRLGSAPGDIAGPIPESGGGTGVQVEALMSYAVTDCFTIGLGGRYWYLQTHGSTDFESVIVDFPSPVAQPLNFTTWRYGGFAQGAYKFGPL